MTLRKIGAVSYARIRLSKGRKGRRKDVHVPAAWTRRTAELDRRLTEVADALRAVNQPVVVIEKMLAEVLLAHDDTAWNSLQRAVATIAAGKTVVAPRGARTFGEFAIEYLSGALSLRFPDHIEPRNPGVVADDKGRLDLYVLPHLRDLPLSCVTLDRCDEVMSHLPTHYKGGRRMSPATRRHVAQIIRRMLSLAAYPCKYIPLSPIPRGWLPRLKKPPSYPFLYPDEDERLLACSAVPLVCRVLYGLLAREGTRGPSEALAIPIHRIDFAHGTYGLGDNKTDDPRGWVLGEDVAAALRIWLDHFHPEPKRDSLLFVDPMTGKSPKDGRHLALIFRRHLLLAGIERPELFEKSDIRRPIRAHDLRATFITLSLARGMSEQWVMDRTGHTTSGMLQRYRRAARTVAEAKMTKLSPLHLAIPEFAPFLQNSETVTPPPRAQPGACAAGWGKRWGKSP